MAFDPALLDTLKDLTVLYVDDDRVILDYVSMVIGRRVHKTFKAENGIEGLKVAREHPEVDVVLTDLNMPEMNGQEMASEIRKLYPNKPTVAITAFHEGYDLKDFDAVVRKPFGPDDLMHAVIDAMLKRREAAAR